MTFESFGCRMLKVAKAKSSVMTGIMMMIASSSADLEEG